MLLSLELEKKYMDGPQRRHRRLTVVFLLLEVGGGGIGHWPISMEEAGAVSRVCTAGSMPEGLLEIASGRQLYFMFQR